MVTRVVVAADVTAVVAFAVMVSVVPVQLVRASFSERSRVFAVGELS